MHPGKAGWALAAKADRSCRKGNPSSPERMRWGRAWRPGLGGWRWIKKRPMCSLLQKQRKKESWNWYQSKWCFKCIRENNFCCFSYFREKKNLNYLNLETDDQTLWSFFFNSFLLKYSCYTMLLVSTVQQNESAIHISPLSKISILFRSPESPWVEVLSQIVGSH